MLILTRRENESILMADGQIEVKVIEVRGKQVKLGIDAPESIDIQRMELIDREKK